MTSTLQLLVSSDQRIRRAVVLARRRTLKLRDDVLGQHLAQFHTPLIEGVDLPDRALRKDAVLVQSYQLAQNFRRQLLDQNRVRRPVTLEDAMRNQPVRRPLRLHLLRRLAKSQRLTLSKDV